MSRLNEFFVAGPAEITADVIRHGTERRRPAVLATSFTQLEMALLLVAIEGRPEDEAVHRRRSAAVRWALGATAEDLAALLESLAPLARDGRGAGSSLYLWGRGL
jgi:hypothetical protein